LARKELKIGRQGGEKVSNAVSWDKGELFEERSVERLISLLRAFHRKMKNIRGE